VILLVAAMLVGFLDPDPGFVDTVLDNARQYGMTDGGDLRRVVVFVVAQVGKPYVCGTAGPDMFDCSGLVVAAYRSVGLTFPRTSAWTPSLASTGPSGTRPARVKVRGWRRPLVPVRSQRPGDARPPAPRSGRVARARSPSGGA
jgi:hypothetical protein